MTDFSFDALRRRPDVEAPNLFAADAADRLILDEAAAALNGSSGVPGGVVVIGDNYGALTLGAAALHGATGIRAHQDALTGERALALNAGFVGLGPAYRSVPLGPELLDSARVVLMRLPRSLAALEEIAALIASNAAPDVTVYAGGMLKHMTRAMNDTLGGHFAHVRAGLARQKARVLTASAPLPTPRAAAFRAATEFHQDLGLWVCARGGAFAGTSVDIGTRFLLGFLDRAAPRAATAVDLGCGTGALAAALALARPQIRVIATDQAAAAVASAEATMRANGVADRVSVLRDDAGSTLPPACADLVVLNPPFHIGASVHAGAGLALIEAAGRLLAPGGELWTVFNSHLGYQPALRRAVGPTRQVGRNAKFTVTASVRR